ncbi:MAG TPA: ankyrin repeat domain-containing protein [Candidatus Acidoferrum sp.]|nr:ankyrin repeat domain-containing protein [Candidatus Acidoferrum sp.]
MDAYAEFAAAVQAGDASQCDELLHQHPEWRSHLDRPMPGASFGQTALLVAAGRGNRELIDVLLRAGASIDARSDWWAGGFGVLDLESDATDFLIERGATVDAHSAARLGLVDRLRELLDRDPALVHARGGDGQTPLHFAANVAVAELLLERGAEIDALDIDHESTPAQYMMRDRREVAAWLVSRGCRTDVLMASALGDLALVRRHLEAAPDSIRTTVSHAHFPKRDPRAGGTIYLWTLGWYETPHSLARPAAHGAVFHLLMEYSPASLRVAVACELGFEIAPAMPDPVDYYRLPAAAFNNRARAVVRLLQAGWPPDAQAQGATALHWAAWHGNAEAVRALLGRGAPLSVRDAQYQGTPLHWAKHGAENSWHRAKGDYPAVLEMLG